MSEKCYSYDGEYFYSDISSAIDNGSLTVGDIIYEGTVVHHIAKDFIWGSSILEAISENAYDNVGEPAEDYICNPSKEDIEELENIVAAWVQVKFPPNFFSVKDITSRRLTWRDVDE